MEIQILSLGKFRSSIPFKDIFNFYKNRISFDLNLVELKTFDTEKSRKLINKSDIPVMSIRPAAKKDTSSFTIQ